MDSYKNCLQAVTREKHDLESRYTQLVDEHQQLVRELEQFVNEKDLSLIENTFR